MTAPADDREDAPPVQQRPPDHDKQTAFSHVLADYLWNRRAPYERPKTTGHIAQVTGISRQTVASWLYRGVTPPIDTIFTVLSQLGVPLSALTDAYAAAGVPIPPQIADATTPPPRPRPYTRPTPPADEWDFLVAQTRAALEEEGLPEETIQHAIARIRDRQRGDEGSMETMERHDAAEHTDAPADDESGRDAGSTRRHRIPPSGK